MLRGLLLIAWLSTRSAHGGEDYFPCEPRNVKLSSLGQRILLTWEDDPSCLGISDEFKSKLVVFVGDQKAHSDEVVMTPDQSGLPHQWNWTSYLPLECASHSVRLTYQYQNRTSQEKRAQTEPGSATGMFPQDQMFLVGSRATFCCVLPKGETFVRLYVTGIKGEMKMNTTQINNQTFVLSVDLNQPSPESGFNVMCDYRTDKYGACAYVGYPLQIEQLECETQDFESVVCHWKKRRSTNLEIRSQTVYQLQGEICSKESAEKCSQKARVNDGKKIWTLTANNNVDRVVLTDEADLRERVHMSPVEVRTSDVNARNVSLKWKWPYHIYRTLNVTCQIMLKHHNKNDTSQVSGVGRNHLTLNNLTPNTRYKVQVRCGMAQHFWKWSEWSSDEFHTRGDVPDVLDVWMQQIDNTSIIIWKKPLDSQSHGEVLDYEVTWMQVKSPDRPQKVRVSPAEHRAVLELDHREEFLINVTVRNNNGSSAPFTLRTPVSSPDMEAMTEIKRKVSLRVPGHNGGFRVSWTASSAASCGYIVEWFPATSQTQTVDWLKISPNVTTADIFSKELMEGVRYLISIYACTPGAPEWLETREGYVKEKSIKDNLFNLNFKQSDEQATVFWDPVDLGAQSAFIKGYTLYCSNNKNITTKVSTDDPIATSLSVSKLPITSYTFTVKALTTVGECGASSISVTLNSLTDKLMLSVAITLVLVSLLLTFVSILCFRNWKRIKEKVLPTIPEPKFKGSFPSLVDNKTHAAFSDFLLRSEEQVLKVSRLQMKRDVGRALPPANNVYLEVIPSTVEELQNFSYNLTVDTEDLQVPSVAPRQDQSVGGFNLKEALDRATADPNHLKRCDSAYISEPM